MRILFVCLMLGAAAAAHAVDYTLDPNSFAPGTNVSRRIPGVVLAVETVPPAPYSASVYAPTFAPLIVNTCAAGELCPKAGGKRKFGNAFEEGEAANECLLEPAGFTYPACSAAYTTVLRVLFYTRMANTISFETSWLSDDPVLFVYDSAGFAVAECHTHVVGGLRDDCVRTTVGDAYSGYRTWISLTRPTADIYTVIVAGSFAGVRIGRMKFSIP